MRGCHTPVYNNGVTCTRMTRIGRLISDSCGFATLNNSEMPISFLDWFLIYIRQAIFSNVRLTWSNSQDVGLFPPCRVSTSNSMSMQYLFLGLGLTSQLIETGCNVVQRLRRGAPIFCPINQLINKSRNSTWLEPRSRSNCPTRR